MWFLRLLQPLLTLMQCLFELCPSRFEGNSNKIINSDHATATKAQLEWCQHHFPLGTTAFTVPSEDKQLAPDEICREIEGVKIFLMHWELNVPGVFSPCIEDCCV